METSEVVPESFFIETVLRKEILVAILFFILNLP